MAEASAGTLQLHDCLERMRAGDPAALNELIRHACGRLQRLTRHMLRGYPGVRRWAQTDDVLQSALVRLLRALEAVRPASTRDFFALATEQVRRELLDLARHYYGPEGPGTHHASRGDGDGAPGTAPDRADLSHEPASLAEWCELHQQIDRLPAEEREAVGLLYYQGLTQAETAAMLGVSVRTVQRRWQSALLKLHDYLKGE
jgi:RNA polymerase sigma factor (sigma-70 family)